ncbi:MAG: hypothetical protein ACLFPR_06535 [Desulfococcaceae bacterium]
MWKYAIVMAIRKLREEYAAQLCNIKNIVDSLKNQELESGRTVVSFSCISDEKCRQQDRNAKPSG